MRFRRIVSSASILGLTASALVAWPATATEPAPRTEADADAARVVARVDVNGNGKKDVVRFKKRGKKLIVRVRTDRGRVRRKTVRVTWIGQWYGAARLDGRRGRELVLLTDAGAHSLIYATLTWRRGKLRVLRAPGGGDWFTDGAARMGSGWRRQTKHHRVSMTSRYLMRGSRRPIWRGKATRYVWKHGHWRKRGTHRIKVHGDRKAAKRFGWRGTTLPPFPK